MAEAASALFVMHGARAAIDGGLAHIETQVAAIEDAVIRNPGLAFDLAKTLVESVCRTILGERAIAYRRGSRPPQTFQDHKPASSLFICRGQSGGRNPRKSEADTEWPEYQHPGDLRAAQSVWVCLSRVRQSSSRC